LASDGAPPEPTTHDWAEASRAVDRVRARFGRTAIAAASALTGDGLQVVHRGRNPWGPDGGAGPD
jgi:hypothetical protein